jgi:hypothetical protein
MAAIAAAEAGARVTIFERQAGPGRKLAATGGGRCNLTNTLEPAVFMERFGPHGRFMAQALRHFGRNDLLRTLKGWDVSCEAADGFHYFPKSQRATDVLRALEARLQALGVTGRFGEAVTSLLIQDRRIQGVGTDRGREAVEAVVLAAGGAAWPALGGCTLGYDLARQAGHAIAEPLPALVGLKTREAWPAACAGVVIRRAAAWLELPRRRGRTWQGDLLFTHAGLSGPLILDLSGDTAVVLREHSEVTLRLELLQEQPAPDWPARVAAWRQAHGRQTVRNLVNGFLPRSLAGALCEACGIGADVRAAQIPAAVQKKLAEWLRAAPVTITGTQGLEQAMVTRGGVLLRGVNPATLESRHTRGLFFAGEVLDLDGPCGGYNLTWAFSSGRLAGEAAAGGLSARG